MNQYYKKYLFGITIANIMLLSAGCGDIGQNNSKPIESPKDSVINSSGNLNTPYPTTNDSKSTIPTYRPSESYVPPNICPYEVCKYIYDQDVKVETLLNWDSYSKTINLFPPNIYLYDLVLGHAHFFISNGKDGLYMLSRKDFKLIKFIPIKEPLSIDIDNKGRIYVASIYGINVIDENCNILKYYNDIGNDYIMNNVNGLSWATAPNIYMRVNKVTEEIFFVTGNSLQLKKINKYGKLEIVAGTGSSGYKDGPKGAAEFSFISDIAFFNNAIYLTDGSYPGKIRKIDLYTGNVTTIATSRSNPKTESFFYIDGASDINSLMWTAGPICINMNENIMYFGEDDTIRKLNLNTGYVTTIAGYEKDYYKRCPLCIKDGNSQNSVFAGISRIFIDEDGNLIVMDADNIRKITFLKTPVPSPTPSL